eukprot:gene15274-biopygen2815
MGEAPTGCDDGITWRQARAGCAATSRNGSLCGMDAEWTPPHGCKASPAKHPLRSLPCEASPAKHLLAGRGRRLPAGDDTPMRTGIAWPDPVNGMCAAAATLVGPCGHG